MLPGSGQCHARVDANCRKPSARHCGSAKHEGPPYTHWPERVQALARSRVQKPLSGQGPRTPCQRAGVAMQHAVLASCLQQPSTRSSTALGGARLLAAEPQQAEPAERPQRRGDSQRPAALHLPSCAAQAGVGALSAAAAQGAECPTLAAVLILAAPHRRHRRQHWQRAAARRPRLGRAL